MVGVHWNSQCKVQKDVDASKGGHHQAKNKQNKSITEEKKEPNQLCSAFLEN